jgi:hypothetical protein
MNKNLVIAIIIFAVTFILPFRFAVLDVNPDAHWLSTFGVFFTGIGVFAGFYFLVKDDKKEGHEGHH